MSSPPAAGGPPASPLAIDSLGLWEATWSLPDLVARAANAVVTPASMPERPITAIAVVGMGQSAFAGDVLEAVAGARLQVPMVTAPGGSLPGWIGPGVLVLAVSWSGETGETLTAACRAWESGATVVAITTGGQLAARALAAGQTVVAFPSGPPTSSAAFGAVCALPLAVVDTLGLVPGARREGAEAAAILRRRRGGFGPTIDSAREAARRIGRTIPLVTGAHGIGAVAAQRFKCQVNVAAKAPAFFSAVPELCHAEIAGWGQGGDVTRQVFTHVSFRHDGEDAELTRRADLVTEILEEVVADTVEIRVEGGTVLSRLLELVLVGDLAALYLAGAEGVDPGPAPVLDAVAQGA